MRHLTTLALAGLFGGLLLASDASACHKKKCPAPAPVCEPAPVVCEPAPVVCEPAPVVCETPKKKCHFKMPKMKFGCHKKAECAPVAYEYAAPVHYATPQATPQASGQGM
ncbi:hypothetical protein P12x_003200 [Tundrisphaera lichenicola]|uniref:hypothetical protein n=1 Tax=Tundrisphaera lichenicola TaxID=2029860 RepID=UPI003EB9DE5C